MGDDGNILNDDVLQLIIDYEKDERHCVGFPWAGGLGAFGVS